MVQIIPRTRKSTGEQLAGGLIEAIPALTGGLEEMYQKKKSEENFKKQFGIDIAGMNPEMKQEFVKAFSTAEAKKQLMQHLFGKGNIQTAEGMAEKLQGGQPVSLQQKPLIDVENLTPQDEMMLETISPGLGKLAAEQRKQRFKESETERAPERVRANKVIDRADELRDSLALRRANNKLIKSGIAEGEIGGFDKDYVADVLHYEPLRTAKGAQIKTAAKDLYVETVKSLGSRPNQWIEQQVESAMVKLGKSAEANLTIAEFNDFKLDLEDAWIKAVDQISQENQGRIPGNIAQLAEQRIQPIVEQRQKELAYDLRELYEREQGLEKISKLKKVPEGTPLTIEMAQILLEKVNGDEEKAKKLAEGIGFEITPQEIYGRRR